MAGDSLHYSAPATHIISYNGSRTNLTMQSGDQAIVDRTKALRSKSGNQTTCRLGIRNSFCHWHTSPMDDFLNISLLCVPEQDTTDSMPLDEDSMSWPGGYCVII
ncbi:hypothetical protein AcV7_010117 [Taiwanofungus camphoratus]|nr:hypothetical protein AcV7_010117 [Antrodia cinnamomea]